MGESRAKDTRYDLARERARALVVLTRQKPPVVIDAIVDREDAKRAAAPS